MEIPYWPMFLNIRQKALAQSLVVAYYLQNRQQRIVLRESNTCKLSYLFTLLALTT